MNFKANDNVWVYTSKDPLSAPQRERILEIGKIFLDSWESHGASVKGDVAIVYDRFVVVVSDDCGGNMCGRAKDAQVNLIKSIEAELGISLLDRMLIPYRDSSSQIQILPLVDFKKMISSNEIDETTIVFNNTISKYGELSSNWEVPITKSWHAQLLN